jgi:hypothetical protein
MGRLSASGRAFGAGIGGDDTGAGGNVTINGSAVTATGDNGASDIGDGVSSGRASLYVITAMAGANGAIAPVNSRGVAPGGSQTYAITPANGYAIDQVLVDGTPNAAATAAKASGSYTLNNVNAHHTIAVTFALLAAPAPAAIPTLDQWAQALLAGGAAASFLKKSRDHVRLSTPSPVCSSKFP